MTIQQIILALTQHPNFIDVWEHAIIGSLPGGTTIQGIIAILIGL